MDSSPKAGVNVENYYKDTYGSLENLISLAKNGNVTAQGYLGMAYSQGVGNFVEKDIMKATGWLNKAVENGCDHPLMLTRLGELLDLTATPQNQRKAYEMYRRAADLGCGESQINLAEMYRCGVEGVVNEDIKEAFDWYKKAADESESVTTSGYGGIDQYIVGTMKRVGSACGETRLDALRLLYKYYLDGDCPEGRPQPTKAVYYITKAAELGDTEAQLKLGQVYLTGSCEQIKDVQKAKRWLGKAAASGNVKAKQLLQQCKQCDDKQHDASAVSKEAIEQSFQIMGEKLSQRAEENKHPFVISQPVRFTEEMLRQYEWSPTAKVYLKAYKLVKQGLEILCKSSFTDESGISLIAHGYLTEYSILQAFPEIKGCLSPAILKLCEENLSKNSCFFEGLLLSLALRRYESGGKVSMKSTKNDSKALACIMNLIHLIQRTEPNSPHPEDPFEFDKNYSSWLHVLYYHMAAIYTIQENTEEAAEAFENSLKCCSSYYDSKRGLGFNLMELYIAKTRKCHQDVAEVPSNKRKPINRQRSKYASWTAEQLRDTAVKVLKEYLEKAPQCDKNYPNACYYLAQLAMTDMIQFKEYYERGQDAEEKRLPFFGQFNHPLKDLMTPRYQLFSNMQQPARCGNTACIKRVKETDLKSCSRCRNQKYCSKECQKADWKNHKASCSDSKGPKARNGCD